MNLDLRPAVEDMGGEDDVGLTSSSADDESAAAAAAGCSSPVKLLLPLPLLLSTTGAGDDDAAVPISLSSVWIMRPSSPFSLPLPRLDDVAEAEGALLLTPASPSVPSRFFFSYNSEACICPWVF